MPTTFADTATFARPTIRSARSGADSEDTRQVAHRRLSEQGYGQLRRIAVHYQNGVLTLHGTVSSYFLKQMAQAAVQHVPEVERVVNRLAVHPRSDPAMV